MGYKLHYTIKSHIHLHAAVLSAVEKKHQSSPLTPLISQCSYLSALPQCKYPHENNKGRGKPQRRILLFNNLIHRLEQWCFVTTSFLRNLFVADTHLVLKKGHGETVALD